MVLLNLGILERFMLRATRKLTTTNYWPNVFGYHQQCVIRVTNLLQILWHGWLLEWLLVTLILPRVFTKL